MRYVRAILQARIVWMSMVITLKLLPECGIKPPYSSPARVTSGAFYRHFKSKSDAFRAVTMAGLERLRAGVELFRGKYGENWFAVFATSYLSAGHREDIAGGYVLPSLSTGAGRADEATGVAYEAELLRVAEALSVPLSLESAGHSERPPDRDAAWPILAQLAGGVMLARAVNHEALAKEIADSALKSVRKQAEKQMPSDCEFEG